jgi:hypothetical protein
MRLMSLLLSAAFGLLPTDKARSAENPALPIGVARMDVTPDYPIRLTGYAARRQMSEGLRQRLWAKALALGSDTDGPRILITVDNCGVTANVVEEVAGRLSQTAGIRRANLVVASSHTHSGPMVRGFAENIFIRDLQPEEAAASDRYTADLTSRLEEVAAAALAARRPAYLVHGEGAVGFAANRRTAGGPVDHALPILGVKDESGKWMAVMANYACHCTTLGHQINQHHGDWAGFAQEFIEGDHPGAIALITIGCGADANPSPRGGEDFGVAFAREHGRALASEVRRILERPTTTLRGLPVAQHRRLRLPFQSLPSREEWERRSKEPRIVGYHARKNLVRLDRGEPLPTHLPYFLQTWRFGDELAMVFLAGEVVVDYALRLKRELEPQRLWITAYANDVPCYIPSRRILAEGGYEAEDSLWYYDRPARLSPEVEQMIHAAVVDLLRERPEASALQSQ